MKQLRTLAVAGFLAATILPAAAVDISGAGATFPYPIYAKWADTYKKETGVGSTINRSVRAAELSRSKRRR